MLYSALIERAGKDCVVTGQRCVRVRDGADSASVELVDVDGAAQEPLRAGAVIACDGIHCAVRRQLYPDAGGPIY